MAKDVPKTADVSVFYHFPTRFPTEFPAKFREQDADWLAPHHLFKILNFHQSLP